MELKTHIKLKLGLFDKTKAWIFTIVKHGFEKYADKIIEQFEDAGWELARTRVKLLTPEEARELYKVHRKEDWYEPLWKYMSSGQTIAMIFVKPDMKLDKKVFKETDAIKDEIRAKYGESDMRNVMHSSNSIEHMLEESSIYFVI